ncbi:outer membrane lipoprotein carrier protein LolA [Streptomyces sp. NPDC060194]|uniref:LolA family protein n=1 Tax=Streptomyces sp. NPDC060194 TaxID=3347069 RepID=UPI0036481861
MEPYGDVSEGTGGERRGGLRQKATRYAVPVAVAGIAAATIGLVPALASAGDPDLPEITARELVEKIAASDTERLSGTVKISTDLGLPDVGELLPEGATGGEGASAAPEARLPELVLGSHTLKVAVDGPEKQKVIVDGDYSFVHNAGEVWAYDSTSKEAYHAQAPADRAAPDADEAPVTPKEFAEQALEAAGDTTSVSVDGTAQVAGRDAYQLLIEPKQAGSTVGSIRIAVDAKEGVPLKFSLVPSTGGKAAVDVGFSKVDFSAPAASTFDFRPPKGAKVTEADELERSGGPGSGKPEAGELPGGLGELLGPDGGKGRGDVEVLGSGWTSVAAIRSGEKVPAEADGLFGKLGDPVSGKFGSGTVFSTRLVNALVTDDGDVYVGAVTKATLVKTAEEAH